MMKKSDAEKFLYKVDMEGLDYAVENYAPEKTGDKQFEYVLKRFREAQSEMDEYIEELRAAYDIAVS